MVKVYCKLPHPNGGISISMLEIPRAGDEILINAEDSDHPGIYRVKNVCWNKLDVYMPLLNLEKVDNLPGKAIQTFSVSYHLKTYHRTGVETKVILKNDTSTRVPKMGDRFSLDDAIYMVVSTVGSGDHYDSYVVKIDEDCD